MIKVNEAAGPVLDWLVAKCEGLCEPRMRFSKDHGQDYYDRVSKNGLKWPAGYHCFQSYSPSTDWAQGGPIIKQEISGWSRRGNEDFFEAFITPYRSGKDTHVYGWGSTPLIAAMRCYVISKLGEEAEVPEELL